MLGSGPFARRVAEASVNEPSDPQTALLLGLGRTVRAASQLDHTLRMVFCALMGSKHAAVIAAGQPTGWLFDNCEALVRARKDLAPEHKTKLLALVKEGREAAKDRNRLVHDVWAIGPDGTFLMQSKRGEYELTTKPWSLEEIEAVERRLYRVAVGLERVVVEALGDKVLALEAQLRWEDYVESLSPGRAGREG
jgi:hypothetical protein